MRAVLIALAALLAAPAAASAQISETLSIPTVDGDRIHVEIQRPASTERVPVILTYSPYNSISEGTLPNLANDDARPALRAARLRARRRRRARHAQLLRLLGLRRPEGDAVGRRRRQLARAAAVVQRQGRDDRRLLRRHDREHGRARRRRRARPRRDRPEAAISRWYGYAYSDGVRYLGNSEHPTDEGFDTPLALRLRLRAARRRPRSRRSSLDALATAPTRATPPSTPRTATTRRPTTTTFWRERDYRKDAYDVRRHADRPRLAGLQRHASPRASTCSRAAGRPAEVAVHVPGRARDARRALPAAARHVLRAHAQGRADGRGAAGHHRGHGRRVPRAARRWPPCRHDDRARSSSRPGRVDRDRHEHRGARRAVPRHRAAERRHADRRRAGTCART